MAAALNFSVLWLLVHFFDFRVSFSIAFVSAFGGALYSSKYWTFRNRSAAWRRQIPQYLFAAALSYIIQLAVFQGAMSFLGLGVFLANLAAC
jgi:putative flippase GtrA